MASHQRHRRDTRRVARASHEMKAPSPRTLRRTALHHEARDHAVERRVPVVERLLCRLADALLAGAEHQKVLRGARRLAVDAA